MPIKYRISCLLKFILNEHVYIRLVWGVIITICVGIYCFVTYINNVLKYTNGFRLKANEDKVSESYINYKSNKTRSQNNKLCSMILLRIFDAWSMKFFFSIFFLGLREC